MSNAENWTNRNRPEPTTDAMYVLVPAHVYERMRAAIDSYTRRAGWDDPELDVDERYRKKA